MKRAKRVWVGDFFAGTLVFANVRAILEKHVFGLETICFRLKQLAGNCTRIAQN